MFTARYNPDRQAIECRCMWLKDRAGIYVEAIYDERLKAFFEPCLFVSLRRKGISIHVMEVASQGHALLDRERALLLDAHFDAFSEMASSDLALMHAHLEDEVLEAVYKTYADGETLGHPFSEGLFQDILSMAGVVTQAAFLREREELRAATRRAALHGDAKHVIRLAEWIKLRDCARLAIDDIDLATVLLVGDNSVSAHSVLASKGFQARHFILPGPRLKNSKGGGSWRLCLGARRAWILEDYGVDPDYKLPLRTVFSDWRFPSLPPTQAIETVSRLFGEDIGAWFSWFYSAGPFVDGPLD